MCIRDRLEQCNDSGSGCEAIAIPHNPNLSNGQLFRAEYAGLPLARQREEAALRARLEPVVEMTQIKGESECRNGMYQIIGGNDELCEFEKIRDFGQPELSDCAEGQSKGAQAGEGVGVVEDLLGRLVVGLGGGGGGHERAGRRGMSRALGRASGAMAVHARMNE